MGNFFKQFKDAMVQWDSDQDRLDYLNDVKTYIQTGGCVHHKNKMLYLPLVFDYSTSKMSKSLGINPNTVRGAVHKISEQLFARFGDGFFHSVENDWPAASNILYVVQNYRNLDGLFLPGFTTSIAGLICEIPDHVELEDCREEIEFLKRHTSPGLERELANLSEKNLRYVLFLMGEQGAGRGRFGLIHEMLK